jgi:hypothetical protein
MKRVLLISLLLYLASACTLSAEKQAGPSYTIRETHPRLYLTEERLERVRIRCAANENAQSNYYKILKGFADTYDPARAKPQVEDCMCFAFLYAVGKVAGHSYSTRSVDEYGKLGAKILTQLRPPDDLDYYMRFTPVFVACYDWLFSAMTPEQREIVYKNFTAVSDRMKVDLAKVIGGRFRDTREMYAYYGLAFYGDGNAMYPINPVKAAAVDIKAKDYCDFFAAWHIGQDLAILESTCKGGAYSSGTMYGESPYPEKLWMKDAWATATGGDLYGKTTCLTGYPLFWLYNMLPYPTHVRYDNANGSSNQPGGLVRFGDYRYIGFSAVAAPFTNIAQAQGVAAGQRRLDLGAVFNWLIQYKDQFKVMPFGGPFPIDRWVAPGPSLIWDIIFRDGLVQAKPPEKAGLPLAYHFGSTASGPPLTPDFPKGRPEGAGITVMRSSWEDPSATLLWMKASSHYLIHGHRDQGSFQVYKKGWLAIDSGQYEETPHLGNYTLRTVAHNSLLVYAPGETLPKDKTDAIWSGYANDGGQRWVSPVLKATDTKDADHFLGGITSFASVPGVYDFAQADITRAYNSNKVTSKAHKPKVSQVMRSLFFLRPDEYVIIFDQVTSTKAEYPKRWLMHSIYRPELDGRETFDGMVAHSDMIPGNPGGVSLQGDKRGGISESMDTNIVTLKGWDFGPADGRLLSRTLLPIKHITRIVGGANQEGVRMTALATSYTGGDRIVVNDIAGFKPGDFVYMGETNKPYSNGNYGSPHWPVDDLFYQGWGRVERIDPNANTIFLASYAYNIPHLPAGTSVVRGDHGNSRSYEFMDAEYKQWPMYGENTANAGPFQMQHGSWRLEVEPVEQRKNTEFLHVMVPCDKATLAERRVALEHNVKLVKYDDTVHLEITGKKRTYRIVFKSATSEAHITVTEAGNVVLDNDLANTTIKGQKK